MKPLAPLGSPPRVTVTKVVRTSYRLEWEYDGHTFHYDENVGLAEYEPTRHVRSRYVQSRAVAYRMAAMRLIFAKRDKLATGRGDKGHPAGCRLCGPVVIEDGLEVREGGPCRYHGGEAMDLLRDRLARWLRWRDSVVAR